MLYLRTVELEAVKILYEDVAQELQHLRQGDRREGMLRLRTRDQNRALLQEVAEQREQLRKMSKVVRMRERQAIKTYRSKKTAEYGLELAHAKAMQQDAIISKLEQELTGAHECIAGLRGAMMSIDAARNGLAVSSPPAAVQADMTATDVSQTARVLEMHQELAKVEADGGAIILSSQSPPASDRDRTLALQTPHKSHAATCEWRVLEALSLIAFESYIGRKDSGINLADTDFASSQSWGITYGHTASLARLFPKSQGQESLPVVQVSLPAPKASLGRRLRTQASATWAAARRLFSGKGAVIQTGACINQVAANEDAHVKGVERKPKHQGYRCAAFLKRHASCKD